MLPPKRESQNISAMDDQGIFQFIECAQTIFVVSEREELRRSWMTCPEDQHWDCGAGAWRRQAVVLAAEMREDMAEEVCWKSPM